MGRDRGWIYFLTGKNFACSTHRVFDPRIRTAPAALFRRRSPPTSLKAKHRQEPFHWPSSTSPAPFALALSSAPVIARYITFIGFGETKGGGSRSSILYPRFSPDIG